MRKLAASVILAGLLAAPSAFAQQPPAAPTTIALGDWTLAPTMEIRVRGEYRRDPADLGGNDLYNRPSPRVRDQWAVMERARLGLGAERGALRAQLTLQDARALGSPSVPFAGARGIAEFQPYEAFGEVRSSGARPTYLRFGRQAVVWGEGRLIGNADFSPSGRWLDAVRGHLAVGNFDFEALAAILEVPRPLGAAFRDQVGSSSSGVQLYGLTGKWTVHPLLRLELFALARIARSNGDDLDGSRFQLARANSERYTGAVRVSGEGGGWSYGAEGAYQLGSSGSISFAARDFAAWAAAAHVQKTVDQLLLTPTFRVQGSYASGDDGKGKYKQFDPLLADPQRFHGQMDLFAWSNQLDVGGRVSIVPWTDTSLGLEYRYAQLASASGDWVGSYFTSVGRQNVGAKEKELGHELDLGFSWRPWTPLELRVGWSGLLLGDGAKAIMVQQRRGGALKTGGIGAPSVAQYSYVQATMTIP